MCGFIGQMDLPCIAVYPFVQSHLSSPSWQLLPNIYQFFMFWKGFATLNVLARFTRIRLFASAFGAYLKGVQGLCLNLKVKLEFKLYAKMT